MSSTALHAGPAERLARAFGLGPSPLAEPLQPGGHLFKVSGERGPAMLKEHWFLTPERAAMMGQVLAALAEAGVCPAWLPAADGSVMIQSGDRYFSLMPRLTAEPIRVPEDLTEAASLTARMHRALAGLDGEGLRSPMWADAAVVMEELISVGRPRLAEVIARTEAAAKEVAWQLVHNDLHEGNFVKAEDRLYLIDFDSFSFNPRAGDVFFAAFRLTGGDAAMMRRFVDEYQQHNPLTARERGLGPLLLAADLIRKLAFIHREEMRGNGFFVKDRAKYNGFIARALALLDGEW